MHSSLCSYLHLDEGAYVPQQPVRSSQAALSTAQKIAALYSFQILYVHKNTEAKSSHQKVQLRQKALQAVKKKNTTSFSNVSCETRKP